ncbi:MAG TPA: hypothetical protein VFG09_12470 [Thermodesulfovibrionales bacterium]|nr:hypothetical protein [Thermodesulfovibrionales bacterium]
MKGKQLLFVTYHDENFEDGLSYALDLAKTMDDSIEILLIYKRKGLEKFDDMMSAISFAEAGEFKTARELISEDYRKNNEDYEEKVAALKERGRKSGITMEISTSAMDVISSIKNILRQNTKIDLVLLSPSITNNGVITSKVLNKLVKTASRPIVTMAKQVGAA